jgi:hypothetical protein
MRGMRVLTHCRLSRAFAACWRDCRERRGGCYTRFFPDYSPRRAFSEFAGVSARRRPRFSEVKNLTGSSLREFFRPCRRSAPAI